MSKTFAKVAPQDAIWISQQPRHVQVLWLECIAVDQFGDKFQPFETTLEPKSFQRARKILSTAGYLEFEIKRLAADQRQIESWLVRNLHGAATSFWLGTDELHGQDSPLTAQKEKEVSEREKVSGHHSPPKGHYSPDIGRDSPANSSETVSVSSFGSFSDSNNTESENLIVNSLRSTNQLASEEEESSTKTINTHIPKSLVSTEEQSNTVADSSSLKIEDSTTANSLRGKQEEDLRSLRILKGEANKIGAKSASNCAETTRLDVPSHQDAPRSALPPRNVASYLKALQAAPKSHADPAELESCLPDALRELEETLQAVEDDTESSFEPGIKEICKRLSNLSITMHVLRLPACVPDYERMSDWVVWTDNQVVTFIWVDGQIKWVPLGSNS